MWPGWDQDKLLEAFPERFDMVRHYRNRPIDNFVYYTQNRHDQRHYSRHYEPFRQAVGIKEKSGSSRDGSRHLVLYSGESQSHGGITAAEYDKFYADAFQRWRAHRGDARRLEPSHLWRPEDPCRLAPNRSSKASFANG